MLDNMQNKVYFGSYSLEYWMKLLRHGDIVLPKYQRHFVWEKDRVDKLVASIKGDLFIPPVTIGSFQESGKLNNLIIDGQQRLTSILLAVLGIYPDKEHYTRVNENLLASDDEGVEREDRDDDDPMVIKWNVQELFNLNEDNSYEAIKARALQNGHYNQFDPTLTKEDLKKYFLGFNYLVPSTLNPVEMQKYYSSIFRSVNYSSVNLLPQESRKALYYLNSDYEQYFAPDFCEHITVENKKVKGNVVIDFTRTLALLTALLHNNNDYRKPGRGYGRRMETYYEHFIQSVVSQEYENLFGKFTDLFPDSNFVSAMQELKQQVEELDLYGHYESIIFLDMYFMGLINQVLFEKKRIDTSRKTELKDKLFSKAEEFKQDSKHGRSPASLRYLQSRMEESINIYSSYVL